MDVVTLELHIRMPWLVADLGSWWVVTGRAGGYEFVDTVARCVHVRGGTRWFSAGGSVVRGSDITAGREVVLVWADDPLTAVDPTDQGVVDAALGERGVG